ncbi:hypothetical protein IPZ58_31205 [Streptomyces roseoverticillatus]|uniref:hypothetical protein n=1 Tax=Streptomyces roseoverticillatus TaxID=66429 RepID=UPI001F3FCD38|nr:hypothetical protein [Streptomyces roseoverticillatus]MCF3106007.1 hypothetical protein [Streptomyces roseoverticillatus]
MHLSSAFPHAFAGDVEHVMAVTPDATMSSNGLFQVEVRGESLTIPTRIYNDVPSTESIRALTVTQQTILHCLYTRHHDGRVRQRHLEQVTGSNEPWVAPFVVQLAGEYVVEILEAISRTLPDLTVPHSAQRRIYGDFIARNLAFFARTQRRVASYWSCYYRWKYPWFATYPGSPLMEAFRAAASEQSGRVTPRHTPPACSCGTVCPSNLNEVFQRGS